VIEPEPTPRATSRRSRRLLFGSIAEQYDAVRRGYPPELVDAMVTAAGLAAGATVLEVGCGTGQLTRQLAGYPFAITAIDLAPEMLAVAARRVGDHVELAATAFEDLRAEPSSFDLIVSATAFHWIDPDVAWSKAARLLRPGGWLAVLTTGEHYDDPFGSDLRAMWQSYAVASDGPLDPGPLLSERFAAGERFGPVIHERHDERRTMAPDDVITLENTRATVLNYPEATRASYNAGLRALLATLDDVSLEQRSELAMAAIRT
jgi:ubiquinone/menaquinone biosynthesis C-methylase UbiE